MGAEHSITIEDIKEMVNEKDEEKHTKKSKKIFDALDSNHNGSLDKKEMMALIEAFWKALPPQIESTMKQFGMSEKEGKAQLDERIFDSIDLNGNGKVTFKEWHSAVCTGPIKTMGHINKGVV